MRLPCPQYDLDCKMNVKENDAWWNVNLIIDVSDVHHKMDVVTKVVRQDPAQNVLCDVVSGIGRSRCLVVLGADGEHTLHGPYERHRTQ
jgi:hypothetical protein